MVIISNKGELRRWWGPGQVVMLLNCRKYLIFAGNA